MEIGEWGMRWDVKDFWRFAIVGLLMLFGLAIVVGRWLRRVSPVSDEQWATAGGPPVSTARSLSFSVHPPLPTAAPADKDIPDEPPPPPPPPPLALFTRSPEGLVGTEQGQRLWVVLQQEAFRQRGEGFREDWAFPLHAARQNLGAPLAKGSRISVDGKEYALQPFARGVLFNEVPQWSEVQNLASLLGGKIADDGLARTVLDAGFQAASGTPLNPGWAFHQRAVSEQLGPPLSGNYRVSVGGQEYSLQVFACDTLYTPVPKWSDVRRLSETPPGELANALWAESYQPCGAPCQPDAPAHQFAVQEKLGTPLSGVYQLDYEGAVFAVQVFATEVIFAEPGGTFMRQSSLGRPARFAPTAPPPAPAVISTPGGPGDAVSSQRPVFAMLPVAGQPRISQLYGYTKFARTAPYYGACQGMHPGIDFAVPEGTPLLAVGYGLVVYAGPTQGAPFGGAPPMIAIVRYGSLYVIYGHSSALRVSKGQLVGPGEVVTLSGTYGGPHLHFEVRPVPAKLLGNADPQQPAVNPGTTMNPLDYFSVEQGAYFERWFGQLGGTSHFCRGGLRDQPEIVFGGPVETRPCTN